MLSKGCDTNMENVRREGIEKMKKKVNEDLFPWRIIFHLFESSQQQFRTC